MTHGSFSVPPRCPVWQCGGQSERRWFWWPPAARLLSAACRRTAGWCCMLQEQGQGQLLEAQPLCHLSVTLGSPNDSPGQKRCPKKITRINDQIAGFDHFQKRNFLVQIMGGGGGGGGRAAGYSGTQGRGNKVEPQGGETDMKVKPHGEGIKWNFREVEESGIPWRRNKVKPQGGEIKRNPRWGNKVEQLPLSNMTTFFSPKTFPSIIPDKWSPGQQR